MLSNAYFLAKCRFDTAENEPSKILQKIENSKLFYKNLAPFANLCIGRRAAQGRCARRGPEPRPLDDPEGLGGREPRDAAVRGPRGSCRISKINFFLRLAGCAGALFQRRSGLKMLIFNDFS